MLNFTLHKANSTYSHSHSTPIERKRLHILETRKLWSFASHLQFYISDRLVDHTASYSSNLKPSHATPDVRADLLLPKSKRGRHIITFQTMRFLQWQRSVLGEREREKKSILSSPAICSGWRNFTGYSGWFTASSVSAAPPLRGTSEVAPLLASALFGRPRRLFVRAIPPLQEAKRTDQTRGDDVGIPGVRFAALGLGPSFSICASAVCQVCSGDDLSNSCGLENSRQCNFKKKKKTTDILKNL